MLWCLKLHPSICRLRLDNSQRPGLVCADLTRIFRKVCVVSSAYDHPSCATCGVLTYPCNRKIRVGAGTYQCSDGHRESRSPSGKPAAEFATERIRTCHWERHEQIPELHRE